MLKCDLLYRLEFDKWDDIVCNSHENIYVFSCASLHLWLPYLNNKKVLVISPFKKSIEIQWEKRKNRS